VELLILVVIWAAVLVPGWLHSRRENRAARNFAAYRRRLLSIEQASHRHATYSDAMHLDAPQRVGLGDGAGTTGGNGAAGYDTDDDDPAGPAGLAIATYDAHDDLSAAGAVPHGSRTALRRRRQIFFGLLAAVAGSLAVVVVQSTPTTWAVHAGVWLLFSLYVALLVLHHRRVVEQTNKVRFLPPVEPVRVQRPAVVVLRSGTGR
jgi:hypothetical protein